MKGKKIANQILILAATILLGCGLIGLGIDFGGIATMILLGVGCCVFSLIYLIICVFRWVE